MLVVPQGALLEWTWIPLILSEGIETPVLSSFSQTELPKVDPVDERLPSRSLSRSISEKRMSWPILSLILENFLRKDITPEDHKTPRPQIAKITWSFLVPSNLSVPDAGESVLS